jgi:hypothetical protein
VALDAVLARFIERSPVTVLAQLGLQRVFEADWIDDLFDAHRQRQYKRELLFSSPEERSCPTARAGRPLGRRPRDTR